jgi:hypothetical protein
MEATYSNVVGVSQALDGSKSYIIDEAHFTEEDCNVTADGTLTVCCPVNFKAAVIYPPAPRLEQGVSLDMLSVVGSPTISPSAPPGAPPPTNGVWNITGIPFATYSVALPPGIYTPQKFAWHMDVTQYNDTLDATHPVATMLATYAAAGGFPTLPAINYCMQWCDNTYAYNGQYVAGGNTFSGGSPGLLADAIPSTNAITGKWAINNAKFQGGAGLNGGVALALIGVSAVGGATLSAATIAYMRNLLGLADSDAFPDASVPATWLGGMNVPTAAGTPGYAGPGAAAAFPKIYSSSKAFTVDAVSALEARIAHLESLH